MDEYKIFVKKYTIKMVKMENKHHYSNWNFGLCFRLLTMKWKKKMKSL